MSFLEDQLATPLMPHATASWLVDNTALTFQQIAEFCGLHILEVQAIADDTAATKLTDKAKSVWGDYQPISFFEFYKTLAQSGGQFFNADQTASAFNSDAGKQAAAFLVAKSGKTMPTEADGGVPAGSGPRMAP